MKDITYEMQLQNKGEEIVECCNASRVNDRWHVVDVHSRDIARFEPTMA
jgi:hypothetical protein